MGKMRSFSLLALFLASLREVCASWNYVGDSCDDTKRGVIDQEFGWVAQIVAAVQLNPDSENNVYYNAFFPESLRNQQDFKTKIIDVFKNIERMAVPASEEYPIQVTCDNSKPICQRGPQYAASMNDGTKTMNFCDFYFVTSTDPNNPSLIPTLQLSRDCATIDLRAAQRSKAALIVHELTHTNFAMAPFGDSAKTDDYAYGFNGCYQLPLGKFDRGCARYKNDASPKCPTADNPPKDGICNAELAESNADTYSHYGAGVYFSDLCKRMIPFPPLPPVARRRSINPRFAGIAGLRRQTNCPEDDALVVDDGPEE